jgi:hypothetical protein
MLVDVEIRERLSHYLHCDKANTREGRKPGTA